MWIVLIIRFLSLPQSILKFSHRIKFFTVLAMPPCQSFFRSMVRSPMVSLNLLFSCSKRLRAWSTPPRSNSFAPF